jgi:hypothetical protein
MKLAHVGDYKVSGFAFAGGWRLDVHHGAWSTAQSYWFIRGKFYQCQADLEPNIVNEIRLSDGVEAFPPPGAVEAMQTAVIQWHYEEPKTGSA